jgi:hypothetical protein
LSEVRWTRTTVGGPNDLGGSVTIHGLNPLPKLKYINKSTKYSKGGITKRSYKNPKSSPHVESTLEPSIFL